jgi:4-hydroxy-tetrahydrodipicolinate synthase
MIADTSPVPVILYNVPGRTASNLSANTTLQLAKHSNIIGIKEASGDIVQAMQIMHTMPNDFFLTSGDDLLTVPLMSLGAIGAISVLANGLPSIFSEMVDSCHKNDFEKATILANMLLEINPLIYVESNPVGIKEVLSQLNICENYTRMPILPASTGLQTKIKLALKSFK